MAWTLQSTHSISGLMSQQEGDRPSLEDDQAERSGDGHTFDASMQDAISIASGASVVTLVGPCRETTRAPRRLPAPQATLSLAIAPRAWWHCDTPRVEVHAGHAAGHKSFITFVTCSRDLHAFACMQMSD